MLEAFWLQVGLFGLLGLMIGSFLNVVIYRLPKMMERQWAAECAEYAGQPAPAQDRFNIVLPGSRCPQCGHAIGWHENIPVLSYVLLGGRCSACKARISLRYPLVELVTGLLFAFCAWRWGWSWQALAWSGFAAALVALTLIDWDTTLLPDGLTLPLLWAGLLASSRGWTAAPLDSAIWGAVAGYLSLWLIYWTFKLATGKEGMGYGDFKLFAALGAWLGTGHLLAVLLLASIVGAVFGGALLVIGRIAHKDVPIAFGPFLAGAGMLCMIAGPDNLRRLLPFAFPF
ncbi:MAG: prepilin peptidase [Burkholderiaceae bacterium]|jgi:leader peptidase (prepilin peptidase)/N-methyltransferase|nr:prepilin peptidase [Burkholderiaceae bacterium]